MKQTARSSRVCTLHLRLQSHSTECHQCYVASGQPEDSLNQSAWFIYSHPCFDVQHHFCLHHTDCEVTVTQYKHSEGSPSSLAQRAAKGSSPLKTEATPGELVKIHLIALGMTSQRNFNGVLSSFGLSLHTVEGNPYAKTGSSVYRVKV